MSILQPRESFVRSLRVCPKCGHRTHTMHTWEPIRCRAKVKNLARRKGEPRLIDCGTVMEPKGDSQSHGEKTMNTKENAELGLLADIRAAVGDTTGGLTQDELVKRCRKMRDTLLFIRDECDWYTPFGDFGVGGDERIGPAITAALGG